MLKTTFVLLIAAQFAAADDFVKQLTPKVFARSPSLIVPQRLTPLVNLDLTNTCAIPLKQLRTGNLEHMDPMGLPIMPLKFDESIKHPAMRVCQER